MGRKILFTEEQEHEIIDFYLTPNSIKATAKKFKYSESTINNVLKKYSICKHSEEVIKTIFVNSVRNTNLAKYNADSYFKTEDFKQKSNATKIFKYGDENYTNPDKRKKTILSKYNVEYPLQDTKIRQKQVNTTKVRYGVDNYATLDVCKKKIKETNLKRYGVDNYSKTDSYLSKVKLTCLEKYGVDNYAKTSEFKNVLKNNYNIIKNKTYSTKKSNNSFNSSKPEEEYYKYLLDKFGKEDVIRQYKDSRYPFSCDFYIKSKDLFIELNLHWSHGDHPFDETNEKDLKKLEIWIERAKTSKYYRNAINVWTEKDVKKQKVAKENNLNYLTIYSLKKLNNFIYSDL